jgi:hypothetical protein
MSDPRPYVVALRLVLLLAAASAVAVGAAIGLQGRALDRGATSARFVCPMHPEVQTSAPGMCPICRMALEPATPAPTRLDQRGMADMNAVENVRKHNILDFVKRRSLLPFERELRGAAWSSGQGMVQAILYDDQLAAFGAEESATFTPTNAPSVEVALERSADPPVRWDRSTSRVTFRLRDPRAPELAPGIVGWVELAPRPRQVLTVAASAILESPEGPYVLAWTGPGFAFERRHIEIGETFQKQGFAVVLAGLAQNDRVVARAAFFVDADRRLLSPEETTWEAAR